MGVHHDLSPFGLNAAGGSPLDETERAPQKAADVLGIDLIRYELRVAEGTTTWWLELARPPPPGGHLLLLSV